MGFLPALVTAGLLAGLGLAGAGAGALPRAEAAEEPDFGFFLDRIEPVLQGVCAQCHAGRGKGTFALVTHAGGAAFPQADHRKNFETVQRLLVVGQPEKSRFLLKPLAEREGGVKHGGGDRITKGDANYKNWSDFIRGVKGPPPPTEAPPPPQAPAVGAAGLVFEAEEMTLSGDAVATESPGAKGRLVEPGAGGGRLVTTFRAGRRADYVLSFRVRGAPRGLRARVDDAEFVTVDVPPEGLHDVAPLLPLDAGKPLDGRRGRLDVVGKAGETVLAMDGREGTARWLSPADLPHTKLRALVGFPAEGEPGREDAWVLFDALDEENGKFFGLADGGRTLVMGVIEAGRPRILRTLPAPAVGGTTPVELGVDLLDGVAVGRLDGRPLLHVNFDRGLGAARFGFLTHGVVVVESLAAWRGKDEVHRTQFSAGGILRLTRGTHRLEIDLLPEGAALDAATVKEVPE